MGIKINDFQLSFDTDLPLDSAEYDELNVDGIAIIGMNCYVGSSKNVYDFWEDIKNGTDCIGKISDRRRKDADLLISSLGQATADVEYREMCYLEGIDCFDNSFFNLSPKEASLTDPSQRLLLESAYKTFEDAGLTPTDYEGSNTGVFIGNSNNELYPYKSFIYHHDPSMYNISIPGNHPSLLAGRLAYYFDLNGPAVMCDTACSSSLVALHTACQSIHNNECEMALVGGVSYMLIPIIEKKFNIGIESTSSRTRTFDNHSDGTGNGEGVVTVLLKPVSKAVADGDPIYAVIKGTAVNHDGRSSALTSPNVMAQEKVIKKAWAKANVHPESVSYIEAHGTGTRIGDPIEIKAMSRAFEAFTEKKQFCAIGSVKSNIGHLDSVAGLAGLVKVAMSLKETLIAPTLHFNEPNEEIDFINSPVYVNKSLQQWDEGSLPRRAGISSFGISGTNCHAIVEEYPQGPIIRTVDDSYFVIVLSAKCQESLYGLINEYNKWLYRESIDLVKLCYTANVGRTHFSERLAILFRDQEDLHSIIERILLREPKIDNVFMSWDASDTCIDIRLPLEYKGVLNAELRCENNYELLQSLCRAYVSGSEINWNNCYYPNEYRKLNIPTYVFERKRCWLNIERKEADTKQADEGSPFYKLTWVRVEREHRNHVISTEEKSVIIFGHENHQVTKEIRQRYHALGAKVITVQRGTHYQSHTNNEFRISDDPSDYEMLLNAIKHNISTIIYLWALDESDCTPESIDSVLDSGLYSLFHISKAMMTSNHRVEEMIVVAESAYEVTGNEQKIRSDNSALYALAKTIGSEVKGITIRCIDVEHCSDIGSICDEIVHPRPEFKIAIRNKSERYIEAMTYAAMASSNNPYPIVDGGNYVVTGGLGDVGLEICKAISQRFNVSFFLVNRNVERHLGKSSRVLQEIRAKGSSVECISGDITKEAEVINILDRIRVQGGKIHGIIHCAGIEDGKLLINKNKEGIKQVLSPKIHGTMLLNKHTQVDHLECFILFSSLSSLIGEPGQSDYAAANAFLDSFSCVIRRSNTQRVVVINWPAFEETGMAYRKRVDFNAGGVYPLKTAEATEAFFKILNSNEDSVIIASLKIDQAAASKNTLFKINSGHHTQSSFKTKEQQDSIESAIERLDSEFYAAYTLTQKKVAFCWSKILGIPKVNLDDEFTSLGGNSLSAVNLFVEIEEVVGCKLPLEFYQNVPTIKALSDYIDMGTKQQIQEAAIHTSESGAGQSVVFELERIKPFNLFVFKNCYYNALFSVLEAFRVPISRFLVHFMPVYRYDRNNKLYAHYYSEESENVILDYCGLGYEYEYYIDDLHARIRNALGSNRPVIISVDCFEIPTRADTYQQQHQEHSILIVGIDSDNSQYTIIEQVNGQSLSYRRSVIACDQLEAAYYEYCRQYNPLREKISYAEFYPKQPLQQRLITEVYLSSLAKFKGLMVEGLKELAESVIAWMKKLTEAGSVKEVIDNVNAVITAKAVEKYLLKELSLDHCINTGFSIHDLYKRWSYIRLVIVKHSISGNDIDVAWLETEIRDLIDLEHLHLLELISMST